MDERLSGAGADAAKAVHGDRPGRMARHDHVVQRLVHHLAEPEEGSWNRYGTTGRESRSREESRHGLALEHVAVHPDALLHGGAKPRRRRFPLGGYFTPGIP